MNPGDLAALVGLALVDSTSVGTLVVPILLVLQAGGVRVRPMTTYLATVVLFYAAIGVVLLLGAGAALSSLRDRVNDESLGLASLGLGVALLGAGLALGLRPPPATHGSRWDRVASSSRAMVPLALTATLLELATMFPYLGAIALITASDLSTTSGIGVLLGYCVAMVLPAVVLLGLASVLFDRLRRPLTRLAVWIQRETRETASWLLGIVGAWLAYSAVHDLWGWSL